jgi:hypothetical protein
VEAQLSGGEETIAALQEETRVRPLTDVLVDLAARLDFMLGENTDALRDEFGGVAGLTRF